MRHYERLDAAISQHRLERGLSWGELAAQLGVSESALRNIRRGRNEPSELTARRIEDALQWRPGSVDAILNGEDPTTRPQESGRSQPPDLRAELIELRQQLVNILDRIDEIQGRQ